MNEYPMLHLLSQWGKHIAAALALVIAGAGIWVAASGGSFLWAVAGVGAAAVGYGLMLSYVELVKLIMDMLVPK
jgi:hypothetical protein